MATGFAIANSILIEAPDGAIVVDVTETLNAGARSLAAFREVTKSPIKAIIYTHNHADHIFGAKVNDLQVQCALTPSLLSLRPFSCYLKMTIWV